jgi:hypothetical protein
MLDFGVKVLSIQSRHFRLAGDNVRSDRLEYVRESHRSARIHLFLEVCIMLN